MKKCNNCTKEAIVNFTHPVHSLDYLEGYASYDLCDECATDIENRFKHNPSMQNLTVKRINA